MGRVEDEKINIVFLLMAGADFAAVHLGTVLDYSKCLKELLAEAGEQLEECRESALVLCLA